MRTGASPLRRVRQAHLLTRFVPRSAKKVTAVYVPPC